MTEIAWYSFYLLKKIFLTFIHFWRDRQSMSGKGAERGRHRIQSRLQALSCQHRARRGARTHELWDHDLSRSWTLNRLSYPDTPLYLFWERGWGRVSRGGAERGRHRIQSRLQGPSCQYRAWCGARTHRVWDHDLSQSQMPNQLSHPGSPTLTF